jgi:hypothetical protein
MSSSVTCADCRSVVEDTGFAPREPCPECGSMTRTFHEKMEDTISAHVGHRARLKRPSLPSDKKLRWDSYSGVEMCRDLGRLVRVERTIDKDANQYDEIVTDLATGNVIYECHEPLSQHQNRGTAKGPREPGEGE